MPASIQDARPLFLVDGAERADLKQRLLNLNVIEDQAGLYRCEATFANWGEQDRSIGFLYFDRNVLDFGKSFGVRFADATLFEGQVFALEGRFPEGAAAELTVLAEDRLQDLRMTRRTRTFTDRTDADLFRTLAQDHGLRPDVDVDGPKHRVLAQVNQSDLSFLRERARAIDAELWVESRSLIAKARTRRTSAPITLTHGSGLRSFRVAADLAHQRTSVKVSGWSPSEKQAHCPEATDSVVRGELGNDESGASILQAKIGERRELLAHTCSGGEPEAKARAEAFFRQSARRFVCGEGVASPDARLRSGALVDFKGLGPLFDGKYHLSETRWVFDEKGLRVEFRAERPGLGKT